MQFQGEIPLCAVAVGRDRLIDEQLGEAAAVDPAEPKKVLDAAKQAGVRITAVLTTHYHRCSTTR